MRVLADDLQKLIPHSGAMCLLDTVESWGPVAIVCTTMQHRSPTNPLRHERRLSSVHAIEFAAQATAVHGALLMPPGSDPSFGLLASVRNCRFHCATLDDVEGALLVEVQRLAASAALVMVEFAVSGDGRRLVEGRVSIFMEHRKDQ